MLWSYLNPDDPPPNASQALVDFFNASLAQLSDEEIIQHARNGEMKFHSSQVMICAPVPQPGSRLKRAQNDVLQVEESVVLYCRTYMAKLGLPKWCPDFQQTPYSLYNNLCRMIAIDTFRFSLTRQAYGRKRPNLAYTNDIYLLTQIYNHFVHHLMYLRWKAEVRNPGILKSDNEKNTISKRRTRVSNSYF
jgi:hypothetical protein